MNISDADRTRLRELAKQYMDLASGDANNERIRLWKAHNSLKPERPMILIYPEGSWREIDTLPEMQLQCTDKNLLDTELMFLRDIYTNKHFSADHAFNPWFEVPKIHGEPDWGIKEEWTHSDMQGGARKFKPIINSENDLDKIKMPVITYDEQASLSSLKFYEELFGDIIPVKHVGINRMSFHLMSQYTSWRGLEEVMMDMYDEPEMLHRAMGILEQGHRGIIEQYKKLNLFEVNNDNTYHNTGGNGWTDELPLPDFDPQNVRTIDMWASAEAQEMSEVSPAMHKEFVMDYEKRLLAPFGLTGYGCCEPLDQKLDDVFEIPNIRRISICPWSDVKVCAEKLQGNYIFSWKPAPMDLCGHFNPERIREKITNTLKVCKENNCVLEMVLKDTHTCDNHPERFDKWSKIASECIEEMY